MKLTDFLGKEYGPGDLVIYGAMSGRSVNMIIGRVVEIYRVWHNGYDVEGVKYGWHRLEDGALVPHKTDYLGKDLGECDSGTRVTVQPLRGARWEQHHARSYWIDSRSGRRIDPTRSKKYVKVPSHYVYADGITFDWDAHEAACEAKINTRRPGMYLKWEDVFRRKYKVNYGEPGVHRWPLADHERDKEQLWWVRDEYHDWVQEVRADLPKPVTLIITENIVKWEGELPSGDV